MIELHPRIEAISPSLIRKVFAAAPPGCLNMGLGQPDLPVPEPVVEAVRKTLEGGMAPYSLNAGHLALRASIADMYARWGAQGAGVGGWIEPEGVIITSGVQEGLFVALSALCGPGDEILVPDPGFPAYAMIAQAIGVGARTYACGAARGFRPRAEAIEAALGPKVRAVVISAPGNPTGALADPKDLEEICALLDARGVAWVSDEIYDRFTYEGQFCSPSAASQEGIVLSGLSKSANMMGWRLGWMAAPRRLAVGLTATHQIVNTCASTLAQAAAQVAVEGLCGRGPAVGAIEANVAIFKERRDRAVKALADLGLSHAPAEGAFYIFVDVRPHLRGGEDDLGLCMRMLQEVGLIAIPGQGFGEGGRGWVRLATTTGEVEEGVRRLGQGLGLVSGAGGA